MLLKVCDLFTDLVFYLLQTDGTETVSVSRYISPIKCLFPWNPCSETNFASRRVPTVSKKITFTSRRKFVIWPPLLIEYFLLCTHLFHPVEPSDYFCESQKLIPMKKRNNLTLLSQMVVYELFIEDFTCGIFPALQTNLWM